MVRRQVVLPIHYGGETLDEGYRLDLLIENSVVIEVKAVDELTGLHRAQLLTYLRLSGYRLGFLINFNVERFKAGIHRLIL